MALVLAFAAVGCGRDDARVVFERDAAPILQRRCAAEGCHGVLPGARSTRRYQFPTDPEGALSDARLLEAARDASRRFLNTTEDVQFSSLLRKPLPPEDAGLAHAGGAMFRGRDDPAWRALRAWASLETHGGEDGSPSTLTEGQRFFAREVQPRLAQGGCMLGPCHGLFSSVPLRLDPGLDGVFSVDATRRNYAEALVHLSLGGWPERSRLALKPLRSSERLPHRGGNGAAAFPATLEAPLARAVLSWARLERSLRTGRAPEHELRGVLFVGGPLSPARVVEHDTFTPGSDLFLLAPPAPGGTVTNLTAALHQAPVEVRDPAVDDSGTRVAFSMRRARDEGATLWELDLTTLGATQRTTAVTLPNGRPSTDRWPAYGPDGRLWFVSNRAGVLAEHADGWDTDLYVLSADNRVTRRSYTPSPELATTFFRQGRETAGVVAFTALRRFGEGYKGVVYRFPPDLHTEYHQHVGITLGDDTVFHMRETPEGNYLGLLLDRDAVWSAGALVRVDRNLDIALPGELQPRSSLPGYLPAVTFLGPYGGPGDALVDPYGTGPLSRQARRVTSDGAWRDPQPLPDGRALASFTAGTLGLGDRSATPDFGLYVLTFGPEGIARRERLVDLPGVSETSAVPVFTNAPGPTGTPDLQGPTGTLVYGGGPMVEALFRQVGPYGPRALREDLRAVRVLGWVAQTQDPPFTTPDPLLYPEQRRSGASPHDPSRVLAEIPLERDGTFHLTLPAGTAFRLQFLDARGMAVGTQHNRWFDIHGGQTLRQGVQVPAYDRACGGCHGSRSGEARDAFPVVDLTARASRSLARFEDDNPDRPRAPVTLGPQEPLRADWRLDVLPTLQRACATAPCHGAARAGGLDLQGRATERYDSAYEALVARGEGSLGGHRYVDVRGPTARGSYLLERLLGEELDAPRVLSGPTPHRGLLTDLELRQLVRWIESGARWCTERCTTP